jgi:8-oxo-dGTP pyrophosphatase MutT (NUDIX family)
VTAGFRRVADETIHVGHLLRYSVSTFEGPDGARFDRDVVHHPGWVGVVPLTEDGQVVLVRQYRPALDALLLELPAGVRDVPGEEPVVTAARELAEEVGLAAASYELLAVVHNTPGFANEEGHIFLATGLTDVGASAQGPEEEAMTVERIALTDGPALITSGQITDAKTQIGLLLTLATLAPPSLADA